MDTAEGLDLDWFAVDRDGHIGHFTTAGSGPVPRQALAENRAADALLAYLRQTDPTTEMVHDLVGSCDPPGGLLSGHSASRQHKSATNGPRVVFLDSPDQVRAHLDAGLAREVLASEGAAVWYSAFTPTIHAELHTDDLCKSCFWWKADTEYVLAAEHGLYTYDWLHQFRGPGPYGRLARPKVAIPSRDLPDEFRSLVERVLFPSLCFAETTHLRPEEHLDCVR
jgi:hypothetical protein